MFKGCKLRGYSRTFNCPFVFCFLTYLPFVFLLLLPDKLREDGDPGPGRHICGDGANRDWIHGDLADDVDELVYYYFCLDGNDSDTPEMVRMMTMMMMITIVGG